MCDELRSGMRMESMTRYGFGPEAMKRVKLCASCKAIVPADGCFCRECGKRLPRETLYHVYRERHLYCRRCGTVVSDETQYCPQCGENVKRRKGHGIF